jgi:hypothetical protein
MVITIKDYKKVEKKLVSAENAVVKKNYVISNLNTQLKELKFEKRFNAREDVKKKLEAEKQSKKLERENKKLAKKNKEMDYKIKNIYVSSRRKGPWSTVTDNFDLIPAELGIVSTDLMVSLQEMKPFLTQIVGNAMTEYKSYKIQCNLTVQCINPSGVTDVFSVFDSKNDKAHVVHSSTSPGVVAGGILGNLKDKVENLEAKGSGWRFKQVFLLKVNVYKLIVKKGGSYIKTPDIIANKKCVVNVKNMDEKCFVWAVLSGMFPVEKDGQRVTKYQKYININEEFLTLDDYIELIEDEEVEQEEEEEVGEIDFNNEFKLKCNMLRYPVECKSSIISRFEKANNISISIFDYTVSKNDEVIPGILYNSKRKGKKHINLLLIEEEGRRHYVWIKNFSRFCASSTAHITKHYCHHCLHGFYKDETLEKHIKDGCALLNDEARPILPKNDGIENIIKFKNFNHQFKHPFVIYADFESILKNVEEKRGDKTTVYQHHECCSYAYKIVSSYEEYQFDIKSYCGENANAQFLNDIIDAGDELYNIMIQNTEMIYTKDDEEKFYNETSCHICKEKYKEEDDVVRDHDHINGKFIGSAHNHCNINRQNNRMFIPVVFHNMKNYDVHFIIQRLGSIKRKINIIPCSTEKYMSLSIGRLRFIDSFSFMASSLEGLVSNLGSLENFPVLISEFNNYDTDKLQLLKQKGVYPYDYMNCFEKFNEVELPSKESFYNKLNECDITDKDYEHAKTIWKMFNMKSFQDYHDLYLKTDVLLLADVFEAFRKLSLETYKLDPVYYVSAPSLSWDSMLFLTNVNIELITNIDMFNMVSMGIRGGISMISHRYAEANNKYMKKYDAEKEKSYIWYTDANSLYGSAMSMRLPLNDFKFDDDVDKYTSEYVKNLVDGDHGYILEVDLEYPDHLHELHNDYPVAPESMLVSDDMLSSYAQHLKTISKVSSGKVKKLIPNLMNKNKYICDYRNLQLYLSLGLTLKAVHRVITYKQTFWLKEYIDKNTDMRKQAKNDFEKDFYKLMINSVFGKTMENVKKRIDFQLVNDKDIMLKRQNNVRFKGDVQYNDDGTLRGVHMIQKQVKLFKPIIVGMCILDISKYIMFDFHYNVMKTKYGNNAKLLFTDTDSLCYHIKTDDLYTEMLEHKDLLDLSNHKLTFDGTNKKVYGKFKDETAGVPITHFCGERAKCYAYVTDDIVDDHLEHKKLKGIKKSVVKNKIDFSKYKDSVFMELNISESMNTIRSYKHKVLSITSQKQALCPFDDKRYLYDAINSFAYGHKSIKDLENI